MAQRNPGLRQLIPPVCLHRHHVMKSFVLIGTVLSMAGCATQSPEQSSGLRGVGTPGVSSYPVDNQATTLQALLDRCRQVPEQAGPPSGTRDLSAACGQLRRTMHNQPGNTVKPGTTP